MSRVVKVHNQTRAVDIARAEWRGTMFGRARGLLGKKGLGDGEGIVIWPCTSVHMFFMRFGIDVLYIDKNHRVVKAMHALKPNRVSFGGRGAHAAIELPAGTIAATGTRAGDQLEFLEAAHQLAA